MTKFVAVSRVSYVTNAEYINPNMLLVYVIIFEEYWNKYSYRIINKKIKKLL